MYLQSLPLFPPPCTVQSLLSCFLYVSQNYRNIKQMKTFELMSYNLIIVKRKMRLGMVVVKGLTAHRKL